jgi:hypothetical protein
LIRALPTKVVSVSRLGQAQIAGAETQVDAEGASKAAISSSLPLLWVATRSVPANFHHAIAAFCAATSAAMP